MKKILSIVLVAILCTSIFSGCGGKKYKDGTYTAAYESYNNNGWKPTLTVVITDGAISLAEYDEISEADTSKKKSEDPNYEQNWIAFGYGITPAALYQKLNDQLVETQDISQLDANENPQDTVVNFKSLFSALEKNMKKGITEPVIL